MALVTAPREKRRSPSATDAPARSGATTDEDVVVLRWPEQASDRERLATARRSRLLLVGPGADPPESGACEEDWVRLPADDRDVAARLRALSQRALRHQESPRAEQGRIVYRGAWTPLSPIEARLAKVLVERFGTLVTNDELNTAGWPDEAPSATALRVHVMRLRRQLAPLGLELRTVRLCGRVLEAGSDSPAT